MTSFILLSTLLVLSHSNQSDVLSHSNQSDVLSHSNQGDETALFQNHMSQMSREQPLDEVNPYSTTDPLKFGSEGFQPLALDVLRDDFDQLVEMKNHLEEVAAKMFDKSVAWRDLCTTNFDCPEQVTVKVMEISVNLRGIWPLLKTLDTDLAEMHSELTQVPR